MNPGICDLTPTQVQEFANLDSNRVHGQIAASLAYNSPFVNVLEGGTFPSGMGYGLRSTVFAMAAPGGSLAVPNFIVQDNTNDTLNNVCAYLGQRVQLGSYEYPFQLATYRGTGPRVCVKGMYHEIRGNYTAATDTLTNHIRILINADIRWTLFSMAGLKYIANSTGTEAACLAGGFQQIFTMFPTITSDGPVRYRDVHRLARILRHRMLAQRFGSGQGEFYSFIGSSDILEFFRDELDVRTDLRFLTAGSFKIGEKLVTGFEFEEMWRGLGFAVDDQPLRFNSLTPNPAFANMPTPIEPIVNVSLTNGIGGVPNPAWDQAAFEGFILMGRGSVRRMTPERYAGEGQFKFSPQLYSGELEFIVQRDNQCNLFLDFGQHIFQIERAYRPERPHWIVAGIYARCATQFATINCSDLNSL